MARFRRLFRFPSRTQVEIHQDTDAEVRFHLDARTAELIDQGMDASTARAEAQRQFGNLDSTRRYCRAIDGITERRARWRMWMEELWQDLRYAVRMSGRRAGFTVDALLTLAFGIGANTAIFSVVHGVLLSPLPVVDDDRVVWLGGIGDAGFPITVSIPNYYSWEGHNETFDTIGAYRHLSLVLTGTDPPQRVTGTQVLGDFFGVTGRAPVLGRTIRREETVRGAARLAVLSHGLWQQRFASDAAVLGGAIVLNGDAFTVIGVMPATFRFPDTDIWIPMGVDESLPWEARANSVGMYGVARLRPGISVQAVADMDRVGHTVHVETGWTGGMPVVKPLRDAFVGDVRPALLVLFGAVCFILLLTCVNLANLLVARGDARRQEFAVRASLGAGRGRLVRQLLTESILLACVGGVLGVILAWLVRGTLIAELPLAVVAHASIEFDARVLAFAALVSALTGTLFGLLPALRTSGDWLPHAQQGKRRSTPGTGGRVRGGLVVGQVALALVLLVGAGLMIRSVAQLQAIDPGFRSDGVVTMWVSLPDVDYDSTEAWTRFFDHLLERVDALPGVRSVAVNNMIPLGTGGSESDAIPDNRPVEIGSMASALFQTVNGAYFATMGIPLLRGRTFEARDGASTTPVAIVDETMAELFWPGENPIGRRVAFEYAGDRTDPRPIWREVVGVVGHVRHYELRLPSRIELYVPFTQPPVYFEDRHWPMALFVRTEGDPAQVVSAVRDALAGLDSQVPLDGVRTMDEIVVATLGTDRLLRGVLTTFAGVAVILAIMGIYGVMAYVVSRRTHEIGVRMALGARTTDVVVLMLGRVLTWVGGGVAVGLAAAAELSRSLASVLFGVNTSDPITFVTMAGVLAAVGCLAGYLPVRRATRIDPTVALRVE